MQNYCKNNVFFVFNPCVLLFELATCTDKNVMQAIRNMETAWEKVCGQKKGVLISTPLTD